MPTFRLLLSISGSTTTEIVADNEEAAREQFGKGEWTPLREDHEYEIIQIEVVPAEKEGE